jgi:hypothetical protein
MNYQEFLVKPQVNDMNKVEVTDFIPFEDNELQSNSIEIKTKKEFYENGVLAFQETIAILKPERKHLYLHRLENESFSFIRIGKNSKYDKEGNLWWSIYRDKNGSYTKSIVRRTDYQENTFYTITESIPGDNLYRKYKEVYSLTDEEKS